MFLLLTLKSIIYFSYIGIIFFVKGDTFAVVVVLITWKWMQALVFGYILIVTVHILCWWIIEIGGSVAVTNRRTVEADLLAAIAQTAFFHTVILISEYNKELVVIRNGLLLCYHLHRQFTTVTLPNSISASNCTLSVSHKSCETFELILVKRCFRYRSTI